MTISTTRTASSPHLDVQLCPRKAPTARDSLTLSTHTVARASVVVPRAAVVPDDWADNRVVAKCIPAGVRHTDSAIHDELWALTLGTVLACVALRADARPLKVVLAVGAGACAGVWLGSLPTVFGGRHETVSFAGVREARSIETLHEAGGAGVAHSPSVPSFADARRSRAV